VGLGGDVFGGSAEGSVWSEYVRIEDAETLAHFAGGPLDGWPAVTRHAAGAGAAWYVATLPEHGALRRLAGRVLGEAGVEVAGGVLGDAALGSGGGLGSGNVLGGALGEQVELVRRGALLFAINHGSNTVELHVEGTDILSGESAQGLELPSQGVAIIEA
jgi:beta-galactosidase